MFRANADRAAVFHADAGFILLEVLVAIVVISLILSAVGSVVAGTFTGIKSAADRVVLTAATQTLLDSLPECNAMVPGTTTGNLGGTLWKIDVVPLGEAAAEGRSAGQPGTSGWRLASVAISARTAMGHRLQLNTVRLMRRFSP